MLYEAFAGKRPDPNDYVSLAAIDPTWCDVDDIVRRALTGSKKRMQSAADFANELTTLLAQL